MLRRRLDIGDARDQLDRLEERLRDEHVIEITRHDEPVFAVVDLDYLAAMLETLGILSDAESHRMLHDSLEDIAEDRVRSQEDVKRELLGG